MALLVKRDMSANPADPLVQAGPGATHSFNENAEVIAILGHSKSLPTITSPTVVSMVHKDILTLYLIEMPFNTFANRANPDQAALVRAA